MLGFLNLPYLAITLVICPANSRVGAKIKTLGLNWFINDNTKLMIDYRDRKDETNTADKINEVLMQLQVKI